MTQFTTLMLTLALITGLCGCDLVTNLLLSDGKDDGMVSLDAPILMDIGIVAPLTGRYATAYGISMERGFLLARDEINSSDHSPVRINFIVEDNMSTAEGAVAAFERLVEADVPAIVGLAISTHAKQAFPIAQENRVVAFSPISSATGLSSIGDYIFRASLASDKRNPASVRATHATLGYERVALIYDDADVYSTGSHEQFVATLAELGVEVTTTQTFQTGETDFTEQLTAIVASNPDALFVSALATEDVGILVQGRELGLEATYIFSGLEQHDAELAGDAAEGIITFAGWSGMLDNPMNLAFVDNYRSTYGVEPDSRAALSYSTLHILYTAIVEALSTDVEAPDSTAIRDALATIHVDTVMGQFSFDPNGEAVYEPVGLVFKDGAFTRISQTDAAQ